MRSYVIISGIFVLLSAISCRSSKKNNNPCNSNVICTEMFAMITIQVKDTTGNGIKLDSAYTLRTGDNEKLYLEHNTFIDGAYVVLDDNYQQKLANKKDTFRFVGYKNGSQIINEPFIISADCCHISKESGNTEVILK